MQVTDFVLAIPGFPVLLVLSTIWHFSSVLQMGVALGVFGWGGIARAVRAQTLSLRERGFVEAARGLGLPGGHIIRAEVLPNVAPFIGMNLMLQLTGFIYTEVGLFFLGAVPYSTNNWGVMLNNAVFQANAVTSPRALAYLLSPLICILLITLALVTLANAVDEFFNPTAETDLMTGEPGEATLAGPAAGPQDHGPDGPDGVAAVRVRDLTVSFPTRTGRCPRSRASRWTWPAARSPAWSASPGRASRRWP